MAEFFEDVGGEGDDETHGDVHGERWSDADELRAIDSANYARAS